MNADAPTCHVLRCPRPGATAWSTPETWGRRIEFLVCSEHRSALDDGAPWAVDGADGSSERTLLMDAEDLADARLRVSGFRITQSIGLSLSSNPKHSVELTLTGQRARASGAEEDEVTVLLSEDVIRSLVEVLPDQLKD